MKPHVIVLMSTYNGEKYLVEQIESVLNQDGVDVKLEIRDDGSKDNTLSIIKSYLTKDKRVKLHVGENVGPIHSFYNLLLNSEDSEYYAFCDQDDYWERDKLISSVTALKNEDSNIPLLYRSNLKVVDQDLNFCRLSHSKPIKTTNRYTALVDFNAAGCTEVFNRSAAVFMRNHLADDSLMHDSWLFLLCNFFGKTLYDYIPHIKYRQHAHNVIGSNKNKIEKIRNILTRILDRSIQPRLQSATALLENCGNLLNEKDRAKVEKVVNYKSSIIARFNLFFDLEIRSNDLLSDLKYRFLILLGMI